jgi:hypothetical protein
MGVKPFPGRPPMVPLMPDIEITKLMLFLLNGCDNPDFLNDTKVKIIIPRMYPN